MVVSFERVKNMNNYYSNEIIEYNNNYNDAMVKIDNLRNALTDLYNSFADAVGMDIDKIRDDLTNLKDELQKMKLNINDKKIDTNKKATNCDNILTQVKNMPKTETFYSKDYAYESIGNRNVYIKDGCIYVEESVRQIPIEHYNGLFGAVAGVGKLFNSYHVITTKQKVDVESMMNGKLSWIPISKP